MNAQIKKLRLILGMTQREFAERIRLKQNTIAAIESGKRNLSEQAVLNICREFEINEEWLRTGKGSVYSLSSEEDKIRKWVDEVLKDKSDSPKRRILRTLSQLSDPDWEIVGRIASGLMPKQNPYAELFPEAYAPNTKQIPLADFPLSAGKGTLIPGSTYEFTDVDADRFPSASFACRVKGESMQPRYKDGDIVYIQQQQQIEPNEVGAFLIDDKQYIKQLKFDGNSYFLHSFNPEYSDIRITSDIICYGKVLN